MPLLRMHLRSHGQMRRAVKFGCTSGCTAFVRISRSVVTLCPSATPMAVNYMVMFAHRRPVGPITIAI